MRGWKGRFSFVVQNSAEALFLRYTLSKTTKKRQPLLKFCIWYKGVILQQKAITVSMETSHNDFSCHLNNREGFGFFTV